jgi:hypothetical protein
MSQRLQNRARRFETTNLLIEIRTWIFLIGIQCASYYRTAVSFKERLELKRKLTTTSPWRQKPRIQNTSFPQVIQFHIPNPISLIFVSIVSLYILLGSQKEFFKKKPVFYQKAGNYYLLAAHDWVFTRPDHIWRYHPCLQHLLSI